MPWHGATIDYAEAGPLARHLSTACFIVISYLSGMRSGEALSDLDDCRPNCVNIARTDRDIEQVHAQIAQLRPIVDDPLAPAFRHTREQHELDRLERIITAHANTGEPHDD